MWSGQLEEVFALGSMVDIEVQHIYMIYSVLISFWIKKSSAHVLMLNLIIIPSLDFLTLNPCVDSKKGHMQLA